MGVHLLSIFYFTEKVMKGDFVTFVLSTETGNSVIAEEQTLEGCQKTEGAPWI